MVEKVHRSLQMQCRTQAWQASPKALGQYYTSFSTVGCDNNTLDVHRCRGLTLRSPAESFFLP